VKFKERSKASPNIDGNMFFVDRENAVYQLQRIHQSNYKCAVSKVGAHWIIPICDNVFGLGN
jgi:hypothetical protein